MRLFLINVAYAVGPVVVAIVLWEWAAVSNPSLYFPPPSRIWENSIELFFSGGASTFLLTTAITVDAFATIYRTLVGFALAVVIGVVFGTVIGRNLVIRDLTNPAIEFLRSIPATATLPLFIILLGGGDGMRIAFIAYTAMWYVILNTAMGVSVIHRSMLDMGQTFRVPSIRAFFRIILPAAMPNVFAGMRIALTVALLAAIVSELLLSTNGIGYQLLMAQAQFSMLDLWSWMVFLALLGFVLNTAMEVLERSVLKWDRLARASL